MCRKKALEEAKSKRVLILSVPAAELCVVGDPLAELCPHDEVAPGKVGVVCRAARLRGLALLDRDLDLVLHELNRVAGPKRARNFTNE